MHPRRLLFLLLLVLPAATVAQTQNLYFAASADRQTFGVANSEFTTYVGALSIGYWVMAGVGVELEVGTGLSDDTINTLDLSVTSMLAVNLRLESPPLDDVSAYVLFGASAMALDSGFRDVANSSDDHAFTGIRGAIGLSLKLTPQLRLDGGFTRHQYDDEIGVNSFRFGVRWVMEPTGLGELQ